MARSDAPVPASPASPPSSGRPFAAGARGGAPDPAGGADPGPRRRAVLEALRASAAPQGVSEVARRLGVHPNTVRFHLDALVADGQVERLTEHPSGPGRPRAVYAARHGMDRGGARRYRLLARMLLSRLAPPAGASGGSGGDPGAVAPAEVAADIEETGREWGRHLVEPPPSSRPPTAAEAVDRLTALLSDLGFDPQPAGGGPVPDRIRLRHCPFLELAEEYGRIVCPLHLALMRGALAELGAPVAATGLEPFAEPGACLAHLAPTDPKSARSQGRTTPSDEGTLQR